jgi:hypothetical protein
MLQDRGFSLLSNHVEEARRLYYAGTPSRFLLEWTGELRLTVAQIIAMAQKLLRAERSRQFLT